MKYLYLIVPVLLLLRCSETNTPKKNFNTIMVLSDVKEGHKRQIIQILKNDLDSKKGFLPPGTKLEYLDFVVDTIFYGPTNRFVALIVTKRINELAKYQPEEYPDMIEYYATAIIGIRKTSGEVKIINDLKYHVSQAHNYIEASKNIREIYFNELQRDRHQELYNINDVRFWNSPVWVYPDGSPVVINE